MSEPKEPIYFIDKDAYIRWRADKAVREWHAAHFRSTPGEVVTLNELIAQAIRDVLDQEAADRATDDYAGGDA